jgi:hypothetical protein
VVKVVLLTHVNRGENMKTINLKNNKKVDFWIVKIVGYRFSKVRFNWYTLIII